MKSRTEGEVWLVSWLPTGGDLITVHTYPCPCRNQFSDFKTKFHIHSGMNLVQMSVLTEAILQVFGCSRGQ